MFPTPCRRFVNPALKNAESEEKSVDNPLAYSTNEGLRIAYRLGISNYEAHADI